MNNLDAPDASDRMTCVAQRRMNTTVLSQTSGETALPKSSGNHSKLTPPRGYALEDMAARRAWLEEKIGRPLPEFKLDSPEDFQGLLENQVGYLGLPLSVAGPLKIEGTYARGEFQVPLCTVEGTLSLSMTRGLYLAHLSGGFKSQHLRQELSRSPIFIFDEIEDAAAFATWIDRQFAPIKAAAETSTRHGKLLRIEKQIVHNRVILNLVYSTGEAAGQNMVTVATEHACNHIAATARDLKLKRWLIESNYCGDKNAATGTMMRGRGHHVICSALIEERFLRKLFRTTPEAMLASCVDKHLGSQLGGVLGMNMHNANALAAIYIATGQDAACVAENCVGITTYEARGNDLYCTLTMPSITVGTVGGATRLHQQRANLDMLGCSGPDSSKKLAEIICAASLGLELSLGGAIVSHEFATAHAQFGRR